MCPGFSNLYGRMPTNMRGFAQESSINDWESSYIQVDLAVDL